MTPVTALLTLFLAAASVTDAGRCFMKHWEMEYAVKARIMPRDTSKIGSCFHECQEDEGKRCVYTHAWTQENGERHCHTFVREGTNLQRHLVSIKVCDHSIIPRCGGPFCEDCVPCRDEAQKKREFDCGVFSIRLRYSERQSLELGKETCLKECLEDDFCLWVEHYGSTCEINRLNADSENVQEIEVTLLDYRCSA